MSRSRSRQLAQTGQVKGKVVDAKNQPIEGATITIEMTEGMNRKFETKTNKSGEFIQIGLQPGNYKITATKDNMSQSQNQRVRLDMMEVNFTLKPGSGAPKLSAEDAKKAEAKVGRDQGRVRSRASTLSNEGKYDEAIAKFNEVIADAPKCVECYNNIGTIYTRKKDYDKAEAAFKKAIELNPNSVEAYNGLANRLQRAEEVRPGGRSQRAGAEARGRSGRGRWRRCQRRDGVQPGRHRVERRQDSRGEEAVRAGRASSIRSSPTRTTGSAWRTLNEGKLPEAAKHFEEYLKLAPTGQYAEQAKGDPGIHQEVGVHSP